MSSKEDHKKILLTNIEDKKDFKYIKNYIYGVFYLFIIQQSLYHIFLFFVCNCDWIPRYISSKLTSDKNNFWINILNLGFNESYENGTKGFYSIEYLKCFVFVYLGSCIWWYFITPLLIYNYLDKRTIRLFFKFCVIVCFLNTVIFVIFPIECLTYFQFKTDGAKSLTNTLLRLIYDVDSTRLNSLPSYHVTLSWLCYIPFRIKSNNNIYKRIMFIQLIIAILVFLSTFIIKQHYIMDGIISIILTEVFFLFYFKKNKNNN